MKDWDRIKEHAATAIECDPQERAALLSRLDAESPAMAKQVARLVQSFEKAGDFLDGPFTVPSDFLDDVNVEQRFSAGEIVCERFEIVRLIGRGGMGEVYEAWDRDLSDHVALKTLRFEVSNYETFASRFRKEIQLARKVTHPNVCRIYDSFRHHLGDSSYISVLSMELLQGQTLDEYLKQKGKLSVGEAMPIAEQVIAGLSAVHAAEIIHRDLKPGNLVLVPEGDEFRVKITDFGIAGQSPDGKAQNATQMSKMMGTPDYMSPEQLEQGTANAQSDIYALGLVLYEIVTGTRPFAATGAWQRLYRRAPRPSKASPNVTENWDRAILSCLQRDLDKRPRSPEAVLRLLKSKSRKKWPVIAALSVVMALSLSFGLVKLRPRGINPVAQVAVDQARVAVDNQSREGFAEALKGYELATTLEPKWSQAWAELAYTYAAAGNARYIQGATALHEARRSALRALEFDPTLAKAQGALGWTQSLDFDEWPKAETAFQTALRYDPNDGQVHYWFGVHLRKKGRFKEAEEQDQLALKLTHQRDPNVWCELAFLYWTSGQVQRLRAHLAEQLRMFPNFPTTRYLHARLLKIEGNFAQAEEELQFAEKLGLNPLTVLVERASLEAQAGNLKHAQKDLKKLQDTSRTLEIDGLLLAGVYASLHDNDAAFAVLDAAYQRRDSTLLSLATSPVIEPLRHDSRYQMLLNKLHFTDQIMQQMELSASSSVGDLSHPR